MKNIQEKIRSVIIASLKGSFDLNQDEVEFSIPPKREFGDISTTIPFVLAKKYKQKPFLIGKEIIEKM